jgi:hypothetical protein
MKIETPNKPLPEKDGSGISISYLKLIHEESVLSIISKVTKSVVAAAPFPFPKGAMNFLLHTIKGRNLRIIHSQKKDTTMTTFGEVSIYANAPSLHTVPIHCDEHTTRDRTMLMYTYHVSPFWILNNKRLVNVIRRSLRRIEKTHVVESK